MQNTPEKYQEILASAVKNIQIADHIIYITYPILKEKQLLLKALNSIYESVESLIKSVLYYDYLWKRVQIYKEERANFDTFMARCSRRLNLTPEEILEIRELFSIAENHKKSPVEFLRKDKIVIMSNNLKISILDLNKAKKYLNLSKKLLEKAKKYMNLV